MTSTQDKWADSDAYEAYVGRWSRQIGEKFLLSLKPNQGSRWLDLGCGTGALSSQILDHWSPKSVLGIEPSNAFIETAENQINDSRVQFRQGRLLEHKRVQISVQWGYVIEIIVIDFVVLKSALRSLNCL